MAAAEMAGPSPSALCEPQNLEEDELATTCNYCTMSRLFPIRACLAVLCSAMLLREVRSNLTCVRECVFTRAPCALRKACRCDCERR